MHHESDATRPWACMHTDDAEVSECGDNHYASGAASELEVGISRPSAL